MRLCHVCSISSTRSIQTERLQQFRSLAPPTMVPQSQHGCILLRDIFVEGCADDCAILDAPHKQEAEHVRGITTSIHEVRQRVTTGEHASTVSQSLHLTAQTCRAVLTVHRFRAAKKGSQSKCDHSVSPH